MLGFKADGQERILETSSLQKGGFMKAQGQGPWQKELQWAHDEWLLLYFEAGRGLGTAQASPVF